MARQDISSLIDICVDIAPNRKNMREPPGNKRRKREE
jgi:hypothetical protein